MRRLMLLVLLALGLPTAALASPFNTFNFDTCPGNCTTLAGGLAGTSSSPIYTLMGNGLTFVINLTDVDCVRAPCTFTGGSVTVSDSATSVVLMSDSLLSGTFTRTSGGVNVIHDVFNVLRLTPNSGTPEVAFGNVSGTVVWNLNGPVLSGRVVARGTFAPIPEPGTLGMLGTGLIGLAGMMRRKLKF
jgi:hypothetical protein